MANINIGGRLHSTATGNTVAGANEILDDNKGKKQSVINQETDTALAGKQATLVSGTNIKTINNESILGSGNITAGDPNAVKYTNQSLTDSQKTQARTNVGAGTYTKPSSGIPASDLASGVIPTVPTISTDISADAASDVKTASPKAVKSYVDALDNSVQSSLSSLESSVNSDIADLESAVQAVNRGEFVSAWDGSSEPVVADIPFGVSVEYSSTTYTGTLVASDSTIGKIYLVGTGTTDEYGRYITSRSGSEGSYTYSWKPLGSTEITLSDYATNSKVDDNAIYETQQAILDNDSQYYVSSLTDAWIYNGTIRRNQYTSAYEIVLFRLPAGKYELKTTTDATAAVGIIFGTIASVEALAIDGTVTGILTGDGTEITQQLVLNAETLLVFQSRSAAGQYFKFGSISKISEKSIKTKISEVNTKTNNLETRVDGIDAKMDMFINTLPYDYSDDVAELLILDMPSGNLCFHTIGNTAVLHDPPTSHLYARCYPTENNVAYELKVYTTDDSTNYPVGKVVGYVMFKDVDDALSKTDNVGGTINVNRSYCDNIENSPMIALATGIVTPAINPSVQDALESIYEEESLTNDSLVMGTIKTNGDLNNYAQESGFWRSGYEKCVNAVRVILTNMCYNQYVSSYAIYDKDKHLLQNDVASSGNTEKSYDIDLTAITGAYYIAFTVKTANKNAGTWGCTIVYSRIDENADNIAELQKQISGPSLEILIPNKIFAIVGTELNLWNDAVSLSVDNSLYSPRNYVVEWNCSKGIVTKRCFRFLPEAGDVGSYSCSCTIFDALDHKQIATKTFTIQVLAKNALSSAKNIVHFGDSLGYNTATNLYDNFNSSEKYTGTIPKMLGTRGTGQKRCEAVGGWMWSSYATAGTTGFRIYVSGVTSINVGAVYSDGSHRFEVYEVNITGGVGNCLLGKHYTNPGELIMPSGTLTKVSGSGDDTVPYTGAFQESVNPLWNDNDEELDINQYKQMLVDLGQLSSVSDKIDAVSFQFGVNESLGTPDLDTILNNYIIPLYDLFVTDNPNCKFIVGLTTSAGNDVDGAGANYGASRDTWKYLKNTYDFRKMYLDELQGNASYPNIVIAPTQLFIDRYYGYAFSSRQISQRTTETEQYHNNFVHPGSAGYGQLSDALFATYIGALTQ